MAHAATAHPGAHRLTRARNPMPTWVREALHERGLLPAYEARPPYQRNDYLGWITGAKQTATQHKRLAQMLDELAGGTHYMRMAWRPAASKQKG